MRLIRDNKGDLAIWLFLITFVLLTVAGIVIEVLRVHNVYEHVQSELGRAVNTAVEYAIDDDSRIDEITRMDTLVATSQFYDYLYNELELTSGLAKIGGDGKTAYSLSISSLSVTDSAPRMVVTGTVTVNSIFGYLTDVKAGFTITNRAVRTD